MGGLKLALLTNGRWLSEAELTHGHWWTTWLIKCPVVVLQAEFHQWPLYDINSLQSGEGRFYPTSFSLLYTRLEIDFYFMMISVLVLCILKERHWSPKKLRGEDGVSLLSDNYLSSDLWLQASYTSSTYKSMICNC
jgi:hypothetical protein